MKCFEVTLVLVLGHALANPFQGRAQARQVLRPAELCNERSAAAVATFEDPRLEAAVRAALTVDSGRELTCGLLAGITELAAPNSGIESLVGIQNLSALRELGLYGNSIGDVSALRGLNQLRDVRLQGNRDLSDIRPLLENPAIGEGARVGLGSTSVACTDLTLLAARRVSVDAIDNPELICVPPSPLSEEPVVFSTYEHPRIRVVVVTKGFSHPWGLAFLPDGGVLVTERPGRLRLVRSGVLQPDPIRGIPEVMGGEVGVAGLLDVALHPRFQESGWVYLTYSKAIEGGATIALARGRFDGTALHDVEDLFVADSWGRRVDYAGSRIAFAPDGLLYMTVGGAFGTARSLAQDPSAHVGKVLRLRDDGGVPQDNPFVGTAGFAPEIFSVGHRNQQGAAVHPETGVLWASEHAPQGGDEVNVILPGRNYGWPDVSLGREYVGPRVAERPWQEGTEQATIAWLPSIAATGMTFYTGDRFPAWKGNLFVGGMLTGRIRGTGHLERIALNANGEELRRERLLDELHQRIRAVGQGRDGLLYVLTDAADGEGALLRIEPVD